MFLKDALDFIKYQENINVKVIKSNSQKTLHQTARVKVVIILAVNSLLELIQLCKKLNWKF